MRRALGHGVITAVDLDYCLALGVVVMSLEMELNAVSQTAANRPMVFTIFTV